MEKIENLIYIVLDLKFSKIVARGYSSYFYYFYFLLTRLPLLPIEALLLFGRGGQ
jgi:hypothetical protein